MVLNNISIEEYTKYNKVYSENVEKNIGKEFTRLKDEHYLEHAGATLYADNQLSYIFDDFKSNIYGNPHSLCPSSKLTEDTIDQIRYRVLNHFNTTSNTYSIIFTNGATQALRLVAENFDYVGTNAKSEDGHFVYTQDNHTSVLGMREYANQFKCLNNEEVCKIFTNNCDKNVTIDYGTHTNSLFVYPAQSNFCGRKYPLKWIEQIQNGSCLDSTVNSKSKTKWFCMLDAASYVSTNQLDLNKFQPDFLCISFYKIFGYPTGLGALLVKNSSAFALRKRYFGGGTVQISLSNHKFHVFRHQLHERFEDGTLPYLSIVSLQHCFNSLNKFNLNMEMISKHVFQLAQYTHHSLAVLHHSNDNPAVVLYNSNHFEDIHQQGGIVNFNLLRQNGDYVGFSEVLNMANLYNIHIRTGCFCNPGACQEYLKLSNTDVQKHFEAGHICGDQHDLIDGIPTGSIRISFGYMSTKKEADALLTMIEECFIKKPVIKRIPTHLMTNYLDNKLQNSISSIPTKLKDSDSIDANEIKLTNIFLYPVKSCAAFSVNDRWELCATGLKYDRQWMIVNHSGVCLTQKHEPRMCLIKPSIHLANRLLILAYPDLHTISIPLNSTGDDHIKDGNLCQSKVCRDRVECSDCGDEVAEWLENALDRPGLRLLRQNSDRISKKERNGNVELSLVNEAQFLLLNIKSIKWLNEVIEEPSDKYPIKNLIGRFRPNFVINASEAFEELNYQNIIIGNHYFEGVGPCSRCQMICVDPETGMKTAEPLKSLAANSKGNIKFGFYLKYEKSIESNKFLFVDDVVRILK